MSDTLREQKSRSAFIECVSKETGLPADVVATFIDSDKAMQAKLEGFHMAYWLEPPKESDHD